MSGPIENWLSARLLALSTRMTPPGQRAWSEAMRAESPYLPSGARLRWAFGCLVAATKLRFAPMDTGTFRVNRWVMLVEALVCFTPSVIAWWEFSFGHLGVVWLTSEVIEKNFLGVPDGKWVLGMMVGFAICGLIGPIGMYFGLRYVLFRQGLGSRALGFALIAASVFWSLVGTLSTFWIGKGDFTTRVQLFVMFTVLPVAGILHLMYLAKPADPVSNDPRLAAT